MLCSDKFQKCNYFKSQSFLTRQSFVASFFECKLLIICMFQMTPLYNLIHLLNLKLFIKFTWTFNGIASIESKLLSFLISFQNGATKVYQCTTQYYMLLWIRLSNNYSILTYFLWSTNVYNILGSSVFLTSIFYFLLPAFCFWFTWSPSSPRFCSMLSLQRCLDFSVVFFPFAFSYISYGLFFPEDSMTMVLSSWNTLCQI